MTKEEYTRVINKENKYALAFADYVDNRTVAMILTRKRIRFEEIAKDIIVLDDISDDQVSDIIKEYNESRK